ncbi:MAG: DoxX protein [Bacteroidota bacterium]
MKYLNQITATIFSLPFLIFGANYFFNFIPMPAPAPDSQVAAFMGVLYATKYMLVVKILEITLSTMILVNIKRALALVLITPIVVNILLFELFIAQQPGIGVILILINLFLLYRYKDNYLPILK